MSSTEPLLLSTMADAEMRIETLAVAEAPMNTESDSLPCRICELEWLIDRLDGSGRCYACAEDGIDTREQDRLHGAWLFAKQQAAEYAEEAETAYSKLRATGWKEPSHAG